MKILKLLILGIVVLNFFNCSKDDDDVIITPNETTTQEKIAYRWYFSKSTNVETGEETNANACEQNSYFQFSTNGQATTQSFGEDADDNCIANALMTTSYEIIEHEGDQGVFFTDETGASETMKIVSISNTTLVLEQVGFSIRHTTLVK